MLDTVVSLGWGAMSLTCEKAEKMFHKVVARGKAGGINSKNFIRSLAERGVKERVAFKDNINKKIEGLLGKSNYVSKNEFLQLESRLKALEELLQKNSEELS